MNLMNKFLKIKQRSSIFRHQLKFTQLFSSTEERKIFTKMFQERRYYEILGFAKETNFDSLSKNDIKRQYLSMIKKYHSDGITDPDEKIVNEEISKFINLAYDNISSQRKQKKIDTKNDETYKDQDQVAMKLFGKKFNQIKYQLFKKGNQFKKELFIIELQKNRRGSANYDPPNPKEPQSQTNFNQFSDQVPNSESEPSKNKVMKLLLFGFTVIGSFYYFFWKQNQEKIKSQAPKKGKMTLRAQKIRQIEEKSLQLYWKKINGLIDSYIKEQPPCLKYPSTGDPDQIDQLIQYTIAPDINIFEISSKLLANQEAMGKLKLAKNLEQARKVYGLQVEPFPLNKLKVNNAITLSLEAERCLHNICIKAKDVVDEIKRTGKYTPPKVFFRFYGYIMFEIREKPLSLSNYKNTEYVSLFDLFFDYYSPILIKRHKYNEYSVGLQSEDLKMFGQVHLNNRKIPCQQITSQDKIVVMREKIARNQEEYAEIWHKYYQKYSEFWQNLR